MSRSAIVLLLCASLSVVSANAQAVQLEGSLYMPVFENGYLVDWGEGTQYFTLYSADGKPLYSVDTEQLASRAAKRCLVITDKKSPSLRAVRCPAIT